MSGESSELVEVAERLQRAFVACLPCCVVCTLHTCLFYKGAFSCQHICVLAACCLVIASMCLGGDVGVFYGLGSRWRWMQGTEPTHLRGVWVCCMQAPVSVRLQVSLLTLLGCCCRVLLQGH